MKPLKEPRNYSEQIAHLKNYHGLQIDDVDGATRILRSVNYYRLSAYGIGLKQVNNPEVYRSGISLEHLYRLYTFDAQFRSILTAAIEYLEIDLRTKIAYHLALTYGAEGYRDPKHFTQKTLKSGESVYDTTMRKLDDEIKRQGHLPCVKHHKQKYGGHFPIWAAVELFTFGMLSSLFSVMTTEDQKAIAREYKSQPTYLQSWILSLVEVRNRCAHYGCIYNMPLSQAPKLHTEYKNYRSNRIFPLIITIKRMMGDIPEWRTFSSSLAALLEEYNEINLEFIGFPRNWKEILGLQ